MPTEIIIFLILLFIGFPGLMGVLIYFRKKELEKLGEVDNRRQKPEIRRPNELEEAIIAVAMEFENEDRFQSKANEISQALKFSEAESLVNYFHNNPPVPEEVSGSLSKYPPLGSWMIICQAAIFEILYNYRGSPFRYYTRLDLGNMIGFSIKR